MSPSPPRERAGGEGTRPAGRSARPDGPQGTSDGRLDEAARLTMRRCVEMEDNHIVGTGAVGVRTKADSVTAFDDFPYGGSS